MAISDFVQQRERTRDEVERDALATIDRLLAEFGDRIKAGAGLAVAAIYIRYSTNLQDSFEAQLRGILTEAAAQNLSVSKDNIFYDLGISGAKHDRDGLNAIRQARADRKFDVFIALATSRLARNLRTLLEVLDEEFVGNGTRCILVDQRLDSKDLKNWKMLLPILGWIDELQRTNQSGFVRASHRTLLAKRLYYSSRTYGFGDQIVPNFTTKGGRPVRMMVIDEDTAEVVNFIFDKFISGVSIGRIVNQLNDNRSIPRPPQSNKKRFSRDFVRRALECERYLGVFVYNNEADVSSLSPEEMRILANTDGNVFTFLDLQIVSDDKFLHARQRLQGNAEKLRTALRKPRSKHRNKQDRPTLLNGFLFCPSCENQLVVTGAKGNSYGCKTCKFHPVDQQFLYSQMPRRLATDMIIEAICEHVFSNKEVMNRSVTQFLAEAGRMQKPDPSRLVNLKRERQLVKDQLGLLLQAFSGKDAGLVKDELNGIRSRLTRIDAEILMEQQFVDQVISLPSEAEAFRILSGFAEVLKSFSTDQNDDGLDRARELVGLLTGGRIEAYQCGPKKAKLGWLQVRFKVDLAAVLIDHVKGGQSAVELVVDVRQELPVNPKVALARELYDKDYFETEIAAELRAGRVSVCKWIQQSFAAEGTRKPDGYQRRKRIETARGLHHYQKISDEVFKLAESGILFGEIAERLKTNRDVITASLRYAHEMRNLPWLDGRARRKSLARKSR